MLPSTFPSDSTPIPLPSPVALALYPVGLPVEMEFVMRHLLRLAARFLRADDGPAAVEYAVMLALIIVVCASVIGTLGVQVNDVCMYLCDVLGDRP